MHSPKKTPHREYNPFNCSQMAYQTQNHPNIDGIFSRVSQQIELWFLEIVKLWFISVFAIDPLQSHFGYHVAAQFSVDKWRWRLLGGHHYIINFKSTIEHPSKKHTSKRARYIAERTEEYVISWFVWYHWLIVWFIAFIAYQSLQNDSFVNSRLLVIRLTRIDTIAFCRIPF